MERLQEIHARTVLAFVCATGHRPRHAQSIVVNAVFDERWSKNIGTTFVPNGDSIENVLMFYVRQYKVDLKNIDYTKLEENLSEEIDNVRHVVSFLPK